LSEMFVQNKVDPARLSRKDFSSLDLDAGPACIGTDDLSRAVTDGYPGEKPVCVRAGGINEIRRVLESVRLGGLQAGILDLHFCKDGCAGSSGINNRLSVWQRTELAGNFLASRHAAANNRLKVIASPEINLGCEFSAKRVQGVEPDSDKVRDTLHKLGIDADSTHNCRVCGYDSCREFARAVIRNEAERDYCFPALVRKMSRIDEKFLRSERLANMGQIASGLAHEVNNPLGLASGYTQTLLGDEKLNKDMKQVLGLIRDEIQNAAGIIQNFLNLSRERPARFESVNFYDELAATLRLVTPRLESSGIVLNLDYMPEPLVLECDPYGIQQVLTNIFLNAWQAMPQGGTLFISVRETPDQVAIRIRDTGMGIRPDDLPRIFDPFFTTKPVGMGTGLGLTIVYKIIEQHHGDLRVRSDPGKGAEFTVTIPRSQSLGRPEAAGR
jgi:signal transduction histidine kinase